MKIKILFFPLALVIAVVMVIWFIYPAYQQSVDAKALLKERNAQLGRLEKRQALVDSLALQLENNGATRDFLFRYIPLQPDEEYLINAVDDAAKRAGVNLVVADVLEHTTGGFFGGDTTPQHTTVAVANADAGAATNGGNMITIRQPALRELSLGVVVLGSYDGMRKFFEMLYKIDRLHAVTSASLERMSAQDRSALAAEDTAPEDGVLMGKASVVFAYMPSVKIPHGAEGKIFDSGIDMDAIAAVQAQRMAAPPLTVDAKGRANPFEKAPAQQHPAAPAAQQSADAPQP